MINTRHINLPNFQLNANLPPLSCQVSVIIYVSNVLNDDVKLCLNSVQLHSPAHDLIIVDDSSDAKTQNFLATYALQNGAIYLPNKTVRGYAYSANQGLKASQADYLVLLKGDTIVTPHWLNGLIECADSDEKIAIVGPLSNTASWQSIPNLEQQNNWASNRLPLDMTVDQMGRRISATSAKVYPRLPFLDGFCLLIKRTLIDAIGYFDDQNFTKDYDGENDFCLRAGKVGLSLAVADNVYVYRTQSKAYLTERKGKLENYTHKSLLNKHGHTLIDAKIVDCRLNLLLNNVRNRSRFIIERWSFITEGQYRYQGKRLLFILPVTTAGGGANVVITEIRAMRHMGVDAQILNFERNKVRFELDYPNLDIPVIYASSDDAIPDLCQGFDAVVATINSSIKWISPLTSQPNPPILGYYVQDFEPFFYVVKPSHWSIFWSSRWLRRFISSYYCLRHPKFKRAWLSYLQLPNIRCFTKTYWNQQELAYQLDKTSTLVGPSCDVDLFQPRETEPGSDKNRVSICAMIRPSTGWRGSSRTMQVLGEIKKLYGQRISIVLFGVANEDPSFLALPHDFDYTNLGCLNSKQLAGLFNQMNIFVDFSNYQAMGLTAMEAMACRTAVIVPKQGGADSFARHLHNSLVINTLDMDSCLQALSRLIEEETLRTTLATNAMQDISQFYPEKSAYGILETLFKSE